MNDLQFEKEDRLMDKTIYDLSFGVFNKGKVVFLLNRTKCTMFVASIIVGILDLAKSSLAEGDYFACDFTKSLF